MENKEYDVLAYYNNNAQTYFDQTINGSLQENYDRFLSHIPKEGYILDFGCGSGRDSKYFLEKGYKVEAIDGSIEMCKLASKYINQNVKCMMFDDLNEENLYDGIWACASIIHVEKENLPDILKKIVKALKTNGVIYTSIKKGSGYQIKEGKYYNHVTLEEINDVLKDLNMNVQVIDYFDTLSSVNRPDKPIWANFIIQKK